MLGVLRFPALALFAFLGVSGVSCRAGMPPVAALRIAPAVVPAAEAMVAAAPRSCRRRNSDAIAGPLDAGASSAIALVSRGGKTFAYLADEEDHALRVIDLEAGIEVGETELEGAPSDVVVMPDGRVAVSIASGGEVSMFEPAADVTKPFTKLCTAKVAAEPQGLALANDGATLFVASRWGHALTALETEAFDRRFSLDLPRDPRAVVLSRDGTIAFVSHVSGGRISEIDLRGDAPAAKSVAITFERDAQESWMMEPGGPGPRPPRILRHRRFGGQGYALARTADGRILAPSTLAEPRAPASTGYGGGTGDNPAVVADVAIVDASGKLSPPHVGPLTFSDCLLPRAAAIDAEHQRLLVACRGLDSVLTFDAHAEHPHDREIGRAKVGAGPTGLAIDSKQGLAYVWSSFDRSLDVVATDIHGKKNAPLRKIAITRHSKALSDEARRGEALFFNASAMRIASDGRVCASCHPDGRDDGFTWSTPDGPRQTPMLAARLDGTAPFGWDGARPTALAHLGRTLERLGGTGIDASERESLFAYIATMKNPHERAEDSDALDRGKTIFESDEAGCSGCHAGEATTDGLRHDVKSRASLDRTRDFDTPSLRFVGQSAPYFHDGRYATLRDLLTASDAKMGRTAHLAPRDFDALEAYLKSL